MGGLDYGDYVGIAIVIHSLPFTSKRHGAKDNPRFLDPAESTSYLPGLHREPKKVGAKFFICGFRVASCYPIFGAVSKGAIFPITQVSRP